ncbi:MAG TPA: hypothetical protein VGF67_23230 [Ktedonobacteraceae bacterium]
MPERPARSRRGWWIAAGVLTLLALASISSFLLFQYLDRSTPERTLDAFCHALVQADYRLAYAQFSIALQRTVAEQAFATSLSQDRVRACTHSTVGALGTGVLGQLELVHASQGKNTDIVTLIKDGKNTWKIDDISRASLAVP